MRVTSYPLSPIPLRARQIAKELVKKVPRQSRKSLLTIGCGDGIELLDYLEEFEQIQGVDFSAKAIKLAKKNTASYSQITISKKDLFAVRGKFDVCLLIAVLEHLKDDQKGLVKINRLLNHSGYLVLGVPAHQKFFNLHDERVGHFRRYEKKEIYDRLRLAGFQIKEFVNFGFPVANLTYFVYNFILKIWGKEMMNKGKTKVEKSKITAPGIEDKMPSGFAFLYRFSPILTALMAFFDRLFKNKDWGTYYLVLAKKEV